MNTSETEMDEILKCGICRSEFIDPRQLMCGHVFCFKCIETDYKTRDRNNGKCPICRTEYWTRPNRAIDSLPRCPLPLRHILSLRERRGQCCEYIGCQGNPAQVICIRCHLWLCSDCKSKTCKKNGDDIHEAFQQHELESSLFDIVIRSRHKSCREHINQDVQWYCHHCKLLACKLCKINFHVGHVPLVTLEARSRECRDYLEMVITSLKKKQKEHTENKRTLTELSSCCKEFVDVTHCHTSLDHCNVGFDECENLILLISKVLENGSMKVVVEMSSNLEERITTELGKCLLLEKVREVIGTKQVQTELEVGDDDKTQTNSNACENDDSSINLCGDTCESSLCVIQDSAHWMCLHCRKWLCISCKIASCGRGGHSDIKHTAEKASDIDPALYDIVIRSRSSSCPTHSNNDVDSYCCQCHVIGCELCCYRHAHHNVVTIAKRSSACRINIEEKKKQLGNMISEYSVTKDRVSKIKSNCHFHILNSAYFESVYTDCVLRSNKCDNLNKVLHFLLNYASDRVLVETFDGIENELEAELQKIPSDNLLEIQKMFNFGIETLSEKVPK